MKKYKVILPLAIVLLVGLSIGLWLALRSAGVLPEDIIRSVNYPLFYPSGINGVIINEASIKYDKQDNYVNYIIAFNHIEMTFSEQSSPDSFTYDPSLYPQFVAKFGNYASFDSLYGSVYLTQLPNSNSQTAIMDAKGTLLFVRSDNSTMSQNSWKLLFNALQYTLPK